MKDLFIARLNSFINLFTRQRHLERNPEHYFNLEDKIHRRINIEGFPYALIYNIEDNQVIVKMLFPQGKDPAKVWARIGER